ncbi:unnamed protein product [Caenorhabditis auriculariae]|uniref:BAAT/Acyl-CoA thioester hydrolase C-terminal domain-containing protein n=1 Tax=Caenorhabditis auriculariae TaxID=2777116 RepID=A0A8S1GP53_9PELO|nr:unnamed protein product [Caenorhabditis auriculariae]
MIVGGRRRNVGTRRFRMTPDQWPAASPTANAHLHMHSGSLRLRSRAKPTPAAEKASIVPSALSATLAHSPAILRQMSRARHSHSATVKSSLPRMQLIVEPADSLVHEVVHISLSGLPSSRNFRLELRLLHSNGIYRSYGVFRSDECGSIDLAKNKPIRGTYSATRPMGLFESVAPTDQVKPGWYCKCTPPEPFNYNLLVFDEAGKKILEKKIVKRWLHPEVQRIEIQEGKVRGTMFKPPGDGPFPTVIDISGTGGGLHEQKGAALASRGFCVLSLAFFQYKDLPVWMNNVDLQYFEEAINYMNSLPFTGDKVAVQGVSFGGTLAILLATRFPRIAAVVSINGSFNLDEATFLKENGVDLPYGTLDFSHNEYLNGLYVHAKVVRYSDVPEKAQFPLERTQPNTAFRFVSSLDDLSTPTVFCTNFLTEKLKKLGRKVEVHYLPGGHLMDPPCFPAHPTVFSSFIASHQAYGGEDSIHGASQGVAWEKTISFLCKNLGRPTKIPSYRAKL